MSDQSNFDFCVFGAGLAGISVAQKLLDKGASVYLIDINQIASGASGTPLGLVNPATGRFGTKTWRAEECFEAISSGLEYIQSKTPVQFYKNTGILRPAQDAKMASRMKENTIEQHWPDGWCQWLDKSDVHSINPDLNCVDGGMWLPEGLTVNVEVYLKTKVEYLKKKGLKVSENTGYTIQKERNRFKIKLDEKLLGADSVIYATGNETKEIEDWKFLPVHSIKGQLAIFKSPKAADFDYSISALGYIASISKSLFIAGSTYEHKFDHKTPDKEGLEYLIKRLGKVYPALFKDAELVNQWAGVRASSPNRKPFVGQHPEIGNMYVFAGLGSKGLLYSEYLGTKLADFITQSAPIPKEVSLDRIKV